MTVSASEEVAAVLTGALRDLTVAPGSHELAVAEIEAGFNLTQVPLSADGSRAAGPEESLSSGSVRDRYPPYSFDGRRLAYSSNRSEQLLESPKLPRNFATTSVSPDGRRVLLQKTEGPDIQLFALDLDTRQERCLTTTPGNKYDGVWSRDGRQIAYSGTKDGVLQLWTQPAEGGEARQLTFGTERMRHASFSPDGRWIYIQPSHRNIFRVPVAGGAVQQVTTFPESGLFLEEPTLSPDGRALVYSRWRGGASLWLLRLGAQEAAGGGGSR